MAGTVLELKNADKAIFLTTIGGVVIDHVGDQGLLSMSFRNRQDIKAYVEADLELKREFVVTLLDLGDDLKVNPPGFVITLPWVMEELFAVGG